MVCRVGKLLGEVLATRLKSYFIFAPEGLLFFFETSDLPEEIFVRFHWEIYGGRAFQDTWVCHIAATVELSLSTQMLFVTLKSHFEGQHPAAAALTPTPWRTVLG